MVGVGPDLPRLKRIAGPTVQFLGRLSDAQVAQELARCKALIFPGEEDFGITPVECMASGRPVVAYGAGGALETVLDGETGLFFAEQSVNAIAAALEKIPRCFFPPEALQAQAARFDTSVFERQIQALIASAMEEHHNSNTVTYINRKGLGHDKLGQDKKVTPPFLLLPLTDSFKTELVARHQNVEK